jgi:hypothetical protein
MLAAGGGHLDVIRYLIEERNGSIGETNDVRQFEYCILL